MVKEMKKQKDSLKKYFNLENLTSEEYAEVVDYRNQCIEYVSGHSSDYGAGETNFNMYGIRDLKRNLCVEYRFPPSSRSNGKLEEVLRDEFSGKNVIDLGSGSGPVYIATEVLRHGARKFVGVDYFDPANIICMNNFPNAESIDDLENRYMGVKEDSLAYLINQDKGDNVITSHGFITDENPAFDSKIGRDYSKFVAYEIARLTSEKDITFHCNSSYVFNNFLGKFFDSVGVKGGLTSELWRRNSVVLPSYGERRCK